MTRTPPYRETQTYTALWIVLGITLLLFLPNVLPGLTTGGWSLGLMMASVNLAGLALLGRLVITVDDQAVRWQFGYIGWPAWEQSLAELAQAELARGTRFGSGIKGPAQHRQYHVRLHSPGVRLVRHDGRSVLLGSAQPERLKTFIDARLAAQR